MSYTLGVKTLPKPPPGGFKIINVETGGSYTCLNGTLKKDIIHRKLQFIFEYKKLTRSQVADILAEYDLEATRDFTSTETNLAVTATPVHIEIADREFNTGGENYREDLTLVLTEVS